MPRKKSAAKKAREAVGVTEEVPIQDSLFGADNAEDEEEFTINQEYAQRFEHNKKREDLQRLQEKYKGANLGDDSDDSTSEDEDDEGDLNTPAIDAAILKMVARIRNKDPELYKSEAKFFEETENDAAAASGAVVVKQKQIKPTTIADVHRQTLLSGKGNEDHDVEAHDFIHDRGPTHVQEQNALRQAFHSVGEEADSDDDVLVPRKRTEQETEEEDRQYRKFLEEHLNGKDGNVLKELQSTKTDDPEGEEFLINYMLNRGWIDKTTDKQPSYDELIDDELDDFEERAEKYETAFNFRFEHPGADVITTHPRDIASVRRKDDKRKREREAKLQKTKSAKEERMEELNRLKNLKKAEFEAKIKKIEEVTGQRMDFDELDLEGDFDPDTWDQKMIDRFNDSYYQEKDDGKPTWDDDIDIDDLSIQPETDVEASTMHKSDGLADGQKPAPTKQKKSSKEKLTKKEERVRKRKIEELVDAAVPAALGPGGRMFKYRQTEPETFGLSVEDILFADDAKLNEYVGLKKLAAFKPQEKVERDRKKYGARKRAKQFQKDLWSQSRWKDRESAIGEAVDPSGDKQKKRKKQQQQ